MLFFIWYGVCCELYHLLLWSIFFVLSFVLGVICMTLALIGLLGCVSVARSSCNRYICVFLFVGGRLIVVLSVKFLNFWFFVFSLWRGR